jgi:polygalacturonase
LLTTFVLCTQIASAAHIFNVKEFGAKGDSARIDTKAIEAAVEAASAAGGGTVYFPAGRYLSYTIHLKNNICLYIDQGAIGDKRYTDQ